MNEKVCQHIDSKVFGKILNNYFWENTQNTHAICAVYATLLKHRNNSHCYIPKKRLNNKVSRGYGLLKLETGISLTTLKKYIPLLLETGLCHFTKDGGFFMTGRKTLADQYNNYKDKSVKVQIHKKLTDTKTSVLSIPIIANIDRQKKQIDNKVTLSKAYKTSSKGKPISKKDHDKLVRFVKKGGNLDQLDKVENTILSNKGFSKLISGDLSKEDYKMVSQGSYWRKKLSDKDIIVSRARYKTLWSKKMNYTEYLKHRNSFKKMYGHVTYKNGRIVKQVVSEVAISLDRVLDNTYNTEYMIDKYKN